MTDESQISIEECVLISYKKMAKDNEENPLLGDNNWPKAILDLLKIVEKLEAEKKDLISALQRNAKE